MTKILLVLRHGKSDWNTAAAGDHDRPLKKRGRRAAEQMGAFITTAFGPPDRVLSSTALRALRTTELAAKAGGWAAPLDTAPELYDTTVPAVVGRMHVVDEDVERLLVCGHEPTLSELVAHLVGGGRFHIATGGLACIRFELASWSEVRAGSGELLALVAPRQLEGARGDG